MTLQSVSTANLLNNGQGDAIMYQMHLKPQIFVPMHMTVGSNGVGEGSSLAPYWTFRQQRQAMGVNLIRRPRCAGSSIRRTICGHKSIALATRAGSIR